VHRTYKYRLRPNADQVRELGIMLETHRRLYNECLEWRQHAWDVLRASLTKYDQQRWFSRVRHERPFYRRLNVHSARLTIGRLDRAFQAFFHRVKAGRSPGYPRFKGKDRLDSFAFDLSGRWDGLKLIGNRLRLAFVGTIRVVLHRPIPEGARIKRAAIKREGDHWYVAFSLEIPDPVPVPNEKQAAGIDLGIAHFVACSDGTTYPNPMHLAAGLAALRRAGRSVSRKKKGGGNRRKAVKKLRLIHNRIRDRRKDHHHKVANDLIRRFGTIAVERLNIRGMLGSGRLSRAIADAGWGSFVGMLGWKAESAAATVIEVDPRGTSQGCSGCGETVPKALSVRVHRCPHCGLVLDRDVNAARNILARAGPARIEPAGRNVAHKGERAPRSRIIRKPVQLAFDFGGELDAG